MMPASQILRQRCKSARSIRRQFPRFLTPRGEYVSQKSSPLGHRHALSRQAVRFVAASCAALALGCSGAFAQTEPKQTEPAPVEDDAMTKFEKSPWLIAPIFSSNPKLGTTLGALAGYLHYFDEK